MTIRFFSTSERYRVFSNFANYPIEIDGTLWPTTEHYYQAQKFEDPERQARIHQFPVAVSAKRYATKHKAKIRADWDTRKDAVMERALRAKFTQHRSLRKLLVNSGDERIEEDTKDPYWGIGRDGSGQNRLGEMLMRLRAELRGNARVAGEDLALLSWLGPLRRFVEFGTEGYGRDVRQRLQIVNVMALMIAVSSAVYAGVFAAFGMEDYWPLIVVNLALVAMALLAPLAHRFGDIAAVVIICIAEYIALFFFVRELGHGSGIQLNYIVAAAVAFAICGMAHIRLVAGVVLVGLGLHLATWFLYPPGNAHIAADPLLLHNLYISSAATTFGLIALIVGYAFTRAERARAEADNLLANILPEPIADRLKAEPGTRVADAVPQASVLFSDIVGFTKLSHDLGAARTVDILDRIVTEFDRLAARHGVEKIKTIGDGYMAVAGVSKPQSDHLHRLARLALRMPTVIADLAKSYDVPLEIRIGIAEGPVMAGVIGADRFSYDVWGETVNLASRLESYGIAGEIQVTASVHAALRESFHFEPRGAVEVKGAGTLETWLLKDERGAGEGVRL